MNFRALLLVFLAGSLLSCPAEATQQTPQAISSEIDNKIITNQSGLIPASTMRQVLHDVSDSVPLLGALYPRTSVLSIYTYLATDQAAIITFTGTTQTMTLPAPGASAFQKGWWTMAVSAPGATVVFTSSARINGSTSTYTLPPSSQALISSDGINYSATVLGSATPPSSVPITSVTGFGTGVQAALQIAANGNGGMPLVNIVPTTGDCLQWSAGVHNSGSPCPVVFQTHASLLAGAVASSLTVQQLGYYASGDGGWAEYDWNANSLASADGVAVVLPTGQSSGTPGRYLLRLDNGSNLRAEAFGAVYPYHSLGDATLTGSALSSTSATFSPADVGDPIVVWYAGSTTTIAAPAQPVNPTLSGGSAVLGPSEVICYPRGSLSPTTYYVKETYLGSGGETVGSTESAAISCGANTIPEFTSPAPAYGAQGYQVYVSTTAGTETLQNQWPLRMGQTWWMPTTGIIASGTASPPGSNTTSIAPPLVTTIAAYVDSHDVTLTASAGNNVTGANFAYGVDEVAPINAALTACGALGGGTVMLAQQYVAYGSSPAIPARCTLGAYGPQQGQTSLSTAPMQNNEPAIVTNPANPITMAYGAGLVGVTNLQFGLPELGMTTRAALDAESWFSGIGLSITSSGDDRVENVQTVGFGQCIKVANAQRTSINHWHGDCTAGINIAHSHDWTNVYDTELWNFYPGNQSWGGTNYTISGVADSSGSIAVTIPSTNIVQVGDVVLISGVAGFSGYNAANNVWMVKSVASGTVVLANSQSSPSTTGTWAPGSTTAFLANTNSLATNQTITGTGIGSGNTNTIWAIDYSTGAVLLANPTTGVGSGTAVSITNPAYTSGGTLSVSAKVLGGDAYYVADSQGTSFTNANEIGWSGCEHADQVSTTDKLLNASWTTSSCDGNPAPPNIGQYLTNQQTTLIPGGAHWVGGNVGAGYGTQILTDGGQHGGSAIGPFAVTVTGAQYAQNQVTSLACSVMTSRIEIAATEFMESGASHQSACHIGANVADAHFAGVAMPVTYLMLDSTSQSNVYISGDTNFAGTLPGAHILQTFNGAGTYTWTQPVGLNFIDLDGCGAGGGGGSGASIVSGTAMSGGAGGGGGGCFPAHIRFAAADLGSTETVTIGAGGAIGAAATSSAGNPGSQGGNTTFGSHAIGTGGGGGAGGGSAAASGGGGGGIGGGGTAAQGFQQGATGTTTGGSSAMVLMALGSAATYGNGGTGAAGTASPIGSQSAGGGGSSAAGATFAGGSALLACGGGGAGGGLATVPVAVNGGNGGTSYALLNGASNVKGPTGGAGAGTQPVSALLYSPGSGGSGGASNAVGTGFAGGAGAQCGGGGGGGAALTGTASGAGALGGDGWAAVWMTF